MLKARVTVDWLLLLYGFMYRGKCVQCCPLVDREQARGLVQLGDRGVPVQAGEGAEHLVDQDLELHIVVFCESNTESLLVII